MALQIKLLTDAVALLAKNSNNKENKPNKSGGGGNREKKQYTKPRTMGAYCWSHGFHFINQSCDVSPRSDRKRNPV